MDFICISESKVVMCVIIAYYSVIPIPPTSCLDVLIISKAKVILMDLTITNWAVVAFLLSISFPRRQFRGQFLFLLLRANGMNGVHH